MVVFGRANETKIQGGSIMDVVLAPFSVNKYENERHARSLDPNHFLQGYNYTGPFTALSTRERLHDDIPVNDLDQMAKTHDCAYKNEKEAYDKDQDKQKHIKNIWVADDTFIQNSKKFT